MSRYTTLKKNYDDLTKKNEFFKKQFDDLQAGNANWQKNYQMLQNHNFELQKRFSDFNSRLLDKDQHISKLYDSLVVAQEKQQLAETKRQEAEDKIEKIRKLLI